MPEGINAASTSSSSYERLASALGDRYALEGRIGEGGMATVYLAEDRKHRRKVAIKVLQESLAHSIGVRRFLQEIQVVAQLQHPHLLTLIDSGDLDGLPYYVMPFLEGQSLRELLDREKRLDVERAVAIAREVADGLSYAHRHHVIHRDIKPSNILMSGDHAVIADFGIATALQNATIDRLTETGISVGSPTYMSPEQAAGERDLDERTDIYSLGCVLYEMLAGQPPIDNVSMQRIVTRKLTGQIAPLRTLRSDVPAAIDAAIGKALATEREHRFATTEEFARAIAGPARPERGFAHRFVAAGTAVAGVLGLVAGVAFWSRAQRRATWLAEQRATVVRLASSAQFPAAFRLAEDIERRAPGDSALRAMRPAFADMIRIVTKPAGARITRREVLRAGAPWTFVGTTPADSVPMPKTLRELSFRLRIELPGYEPREVLPDIFAGPNAVDTLRLDRAGEAPGFVRIPGFSMIDRLHAGVFADYHIGRHEVTNGEFARFVAAGGYEKSEYWTEPFVREGRSVPWRDAVKEFRDRTGMPGPATWSGGRFPAGQDSFPVAGVSYYEAAAYARFAGARLPTSVHWSRAALRNNREASWIYLPESNLNGSGVRAVGRGEINAFGLYDVAGNVREWCANPMPGGHLLRGASWEDDAYWVTGQVMRPDWDRSPGNGFRLVRLSDNDTTIAHLAGPVAPTPSRDFSVASRVTDTEYSFYQRLFDYDHTPLNARVDTQGVVGAYRWEKVSFDAPYRGERMSAYVLLPKTHTAPFEPILFWSHAGVLTARTFDPGHWSFENYIGFLPQNGRAVVFPVLKGMFERDDSAFSIVWRAPEKTAAYRDLVIQWIKEIRRTVDYIESRADIKADRLGFFSFSWGSQMAPMALALEPRFKAAVINLGGYWPEGEAFPEVELSTYASRVRIPALLLNGEYDTVFPYATNQRPFFEQLGTPAKDKKHVRYPTSHSLPADALARETLSWFDRYLTSGAPR